MLRFCGNLPNAVCDRNYPAGPISQEILQAIIEITSYSSVWFYRFQVFVEISFILNVLDYTGHAWRVPFS